MASEALQTYKFKNFNEILGYYATVLKNSMLESDSGHGLEADTPFLPKSWTVTTTDEWGRSETTIIPNSGYVYGQSILDAFKSTANSIKHSLMTLFINHDDDKVMWQEDLNYNLINAYASASQSLQWYNKDTEEFEEKPEYWFTRGCWYDMLPMCTKGAYIRKYQANVQNAIEAVRKCRKAYQNYEYVEYSTDEYGYSYSYTVSRRNTVRTRHIGYSSVSNSRFFVQHFWSDYLPKLKSEIDAQLEPIWKFGRATNYPEQNASTADLEYITQLASSIGANSTSSAKTTITTAKKLSTNCGTYDAKAAKMTLSK